MSATNRKQLIPITDTFISEFSGIKSDPTLQNRLFQTLPYYLSFVFVVEPKKKHLVGHQKLANLKQENQAGLLHLSVCH